ncbi:hypothetical protein AB2S62_21775 [Vibrio sp. NTOU-M3]|uniref:hypothetical protein n=1 Tax=Vibrio sp. NTOU-M3 TaxID=3234954 RepID=UPI00349FCF2D
MKTLSIDECNRDLAALDAADKLTHSMRSEVERFKEMDSQELLKKASSIFFSGNFSLEALGLPANLFEQLEQLEKLNSVARAKLRARVIADQHALSEIENAQIVEGGHV